MSSEGPGPAEDADTGDRDGRREVVVPLRLYKTVTVFSTLIAIVGVVSGFVLLDAATLRVSLVRGAVVAVLSAVGLVPQPATLDALLGISGLAVIGGGAAVYVLGTRFRAPGMGKSQADGDGGSDDG